MIRRLLLAALAVALAACLDFTQPRVTAEQRQVFNRAGVVVLLAPRPILHQIAATATQSTTGQADLAGWDVRAEVTRFLKARLAGKGLAVESLAYDPADFAAAYDSSVGFARPERVRATLAALAAAQDVDMVVAVYRQTSKDFVAESVENLVGYGVVKHPGGPAQAYATVYVEAVGTRGAALLGQADGQHAVPLPPDGWQERYATEDEALSIAEPDAAVLRSGIANALTGAVLVAAQEAGLSH